MQKGNYLDCDQEQGQARRIWTYHLKKAQYNRGPIFLRPHCGQPSEHTSYPKVSNERYVHYLSNDHSLILTEWFGHSALPK